MSSFFSFFTLSPALPYLLILALPLRGTIFAGLGGQSIGGAGAARLTTTRVALSCVLSYFTFISIGLSGEFISRKLAP